jgi:ferric-dicitrate binding protein FerR (iron transport regulator)
METDRFEELLEAYQSGEVSATSQADLERLLRADPALRCRFIERCLLEVQLRKVCTSLLPQSAPAAPPRRRWFRVGVGVAAAALLLVAWAWLWSSGFRPNLLPGAEVVAGQVRIDGGPVTRVPAGVTFEIVGDAPAILRLPDGSRAELDPASYAKIPRRNGDTRQTVALTRGGGTFQVAHGGGQFLVETPVGTVLALGTEFSVKLQPRAKGKAGSRSGLRLTVIVVAGTVQVDAGGKSYRLSKGKRGDFDDGDQNNQDDGEQNNRNDGERNNRNNDR